MEAQVIVNHAEISWKFYEGAENRRTYSVLHLSVCICALFMRVYALHAYRIFECPQKNRKTQIWRTSPRLYIMQLAN